MRYIQHPETLELIPAENYCRENKSAFVLKDIAPYESIVTGELITSRSKHREHLKIHGKQEVGNEMPAWLKEQKYRRKHGDDA